MDLNKYTRIIQHTDTHRYYGKIDKVIGMMIESVGPDCRVGDLCRIYSTPGGRYIEAEVVGFRGNKVLLMPYEDPEGISSGNLVESTGAALTIGISENLIGRADRIMFSSAGSSMLYFWTWRSDRFFKAIE